MATIEVPHRVPPHRRPTMTSDMMSEPFTRDQVIAACRALGLDPRRVVDLRIEPRRVTVVTAEPVLPIRRVTTVHPILAGGRHPTKISDNPKAPDLCPKCRPDKPRTDVGLFGGEQS